MLILFPPVEHIFKYRYFHRYFLRYQVFLYCLFLVCVYGLITFPDKISGFKLLQVLLFCPLIST